MDIEILKLLIQIAISIGAAFLAAWLAAKRFREDKLWERKLEAYSDLVDALHKMKFPPGEHFDAAIECREINDSYSSELWAEFKQARRNVLRIAESSSLLLSQEVMIAVQKMESGLSKARNAHSWEEHLDEQWGVIEACLEEVKRIGGKELAVQHA